MNGDAPPGDPGRRSRLHSRLHGRRRGRKLRAAQRGLLETALPPLLLKPEDLAGCDPRSLFAGAPAEIWLEIGFGGGEHLADQASRNPGIGLIGCEVFENGVVSLLGHLARRETTNVRIVTEDARDLLAALAPGTIDRAFILFPDPWPKTRHHKRRLISAEIMDALARVMRPGAELRLATDDVAYLRVMLAEACGHPAFDWLVRRPADWRDRPADWPATRYEAKAIKAGRRPAFLRLRRG